MWVHAGCTSAAGQMNHDFGPLKEVADLHASASVLPTFDELHFALRPDAFMKDVLCLDAAFLQHFLKIL